MLGGSNILVQAGINPGYSGAFIRALEATSNDWTRISSERPSQRRTETVPITGRAPAVRQWTGTRQTGGALEKQKTITHLKFETSVEVEKDTLDDDQSGDMQKVIGSLGTRIGNYPNKVVFGDLIDNAEVTTSRFGASWESTSAAFLDTDHSYTGGVYTTNQDNDLTFAAATGTLPTLSELQGGVQQAQAAILGMKDDQGEPYWEGNPPQRWILVVPPAYAQVAKQFAQSANVPAYGMTGVAADNILRGSVEVIVNLYTSASTKIWVIAEAGGEARPFGISMRRGVRLQAVRSTPGTNDRTTFDTDIEAYGADIRLEGFYGEFQSICLLTVT